MSKYKVGDRVRVVLEGEVGDPYSGTFRVGAGVYANRIDPGAEHVVSVEKIEPQVEVFQPGDRLRSKTMNFEVTLASDGYLHHFRDGEVEFFSFPKADSFTSKDYEKVSPG